MKKVLTLTLALILTLSLAACSDKGTTSNPGSSGGNSKPTSTTKPKPTTNESTEPETTESPDPETDTPKETNSTDVPSDKDEPMEGIGNNNVNGGYIKYYDGYIYLDHVGTMPRGPIGNTMYRIRPDGSDFVLAGSDAETGVSNINVADGWLYYIDQYSHIIKRMRVDGTDEESFYSECYDLTLVGDWLYFWSYNTYKLKDTFVKENRIYRMHTDGTDVEQLGGPNTNQMFLAGEWIYYADHSSYLIHRMRLDGSEDTVIGSQGDYFTQNPFMVIGDWIYFINDGYFMDNKNLRGQLKRIKTDGTKIETLTEGNINRMNAYGDWLYFSTDDGFYRMHHDGSGKELLRDSGGDTRIYIINDWIYYDNRYMRLDGSNLTNWYNEFGYDRDELYEKK